jgi:hypothetical protein
MFLDNRLSNMPRCFGYRPEDLAMRIPESIRKNVVFLGRMIQRGSQESPYFAGTGFFVSVSSCTAPEYRYLYLVTAKHVVEQMVLGDWFMRINTTGGDFKDVRMKKDTKWWFHPMEEDTTDVAVTNASLPENADLVAVSEEMFLEKTALSANGIGAGDEVFMVGLFNRMRGRSRNLPLVRIGNIAMIPDDGELIPGIKIGNDRFVDAEAYLIEARSIGGLSGSPVFVHTTVGAENSMRDHQGPFGQTSSFLSGSISLLGLVNGHWDIHPEEKNNPDPRGGGKPEAVNLGIAVVIPVKKIRDTLYHYELVESRRQADRQRIVSGSSTLD